MNHSPVKSLCDMYVRSASGDKALIPLFHELGTHRILSTETDGDRKYIFPKRLFIYASSRIYLMVNEINMLNIYTHSESILENFTVSFLDFETCEAFYCDREMFKSVKQNRRKAMIAVVRETFKASYDKTMTGWYRKQLGEQLFSSVIKDDLVICLCPIAKLFDRKLKVPNCTDVLGFDVGGFVVPQLRSCDVKGK